MRQISFALTTDQIRQQTKTVTRRLGWHTLMAGQHLQAVEKCQGLKKGERVQKLAVIRVTDVRRERLDRLVNELGYGFEEVQLEGFGDHPTLRWPSEFVKFFCSSHRPCRPDWEVTRISFAYEGQP